MDDIQRARKAISRAVQRYRRERGEYVPISEVPFPIINGALLKEFGEEEGPSLADMMRLLEDMEKHSPGPRGGDVTPRRLW